MVQTIMLLPYKISKMKRIVLFILLLIAVQSFGQVPHPVGFFKALVGGGPSLLLDDYPAEAAYSLRKLRTAYSGSAVRIRRSSDDTEQDIGFSSGDFDATSFSSFIGGGNGYVVTWYDQSGNGYNLPTGSFSEQPQLLLNTFQGKPVINFDGTNDAFALTNFLSGSSALTLFGVDSVGASAGANNGHFVYVDGAGSTSHYPFVDENIYDAFGTNSRKSAGSPPSALRAKHLYTVISAASDWRSYVNATSDFTTTSNTVSASTGFFIGVNNGLYHKGAVTEVIIYTSAKNNTDRDAIWVNINAYHTIY